MDHLPIPVHLKDLKLQVPHLNLVSYDGQSFPEFLQRLGYTGTDILAMLHDTDKVRMAESILQEWLYFGILHSVSEITHIPIDLNQFIHVNENGSRTVVSQHWLDVFAALSEKETPFTEEQHSKLLGRLNYASDVLGAVARGWPQWHLHLTPAIIFSICILVETVSEALRLLSNFRTPISTSYMSLMPGLYFENAMRESGWCVASVQGVLHGNVSVGYFASLLSSYSDQPHPDCTDIKCHKVYVEVGDMPRQHAEQDCQDQCDEVAVDQLALSTILDKGSFPAVIAQEIAGDIVLKVIDAHDLDYVAISHVWAHGLGNPTANSMPRCQVRRLLRMINDLLPGHPCAFWIDTLCVPVHIKSYRKMSISRLSRTYRQAAKVIILDRQLLHVPSTNTAEAVCRVLCSDWMSRLWTLQEGLLPKLDAIHVQFQNGAVPIASLCSEGTEKPMPNIVENKLRRYLSSRFLDRDTFGEIEGGGSMGSSPDTKLLAIMRSLQRRRTTKQADEAVCVATLMGLDLNSFEGTPTMEDLYRHLYRLPRNLIFAPSSRLESPGFRWAPSTFLEQPITALRIPYGMTHGLATSKGFDFMCLSIRLLDSITIAKDDSSDIIIQFSSGQDSLNYALFIPNFADHPAVESLCVKHPVIILESQDSTSAAVLLEVTDNTRPWATVCGTYQLPGYLKQIETPSKQERSKESSITRGEHVLTQNWLID